MIWHSVVAKVPVLHLKYSFRDFILLLKRLPLSLTCYTRRGCPASENLSEC